MSTLQYRTHMPSKWIFHEFWPTHPKIEKAPEIRMLLC